MSKNHRQRLKSPILTDKDFAFNPSVPSLCNSIDIKTGSEVESLPSVKKNKIVVGDKTRFPKLSIRDRRRPFLAEFEKKNAGSLEIPVKNNQEDILSNEKVTICEKMTPGKRKFNFNKDENNKKQKVRKSD